MELKWPLCGVVFTVLLVSGIKAQLDVCGITHPDSRIVGGNNAPAGAWPWHAAVFSFGNLRCSGSLINDRWILTAATCVYRSAPQLLKVVLGAGALDEPSPYMVELNVSDIIVHPSFDVSKGHNIALLNLSSPVNFNRYIRPVCLAQSGSVYEEGSCWVTGFGTVGWLDPNPYPRYLREVRVPIVANSECDQPADIICAGKKGKGVCDEDLGAPLVSKNTTEDRWVQGGVVVSQGQLCAAYKGWSDRYTRVSNYEDWIKSQIVTNQPGFIIGASRSPGTSSVSLPLLLLLLLLSSVLVETV